MDETLPGDGVPPPGHRYPGAGDPPRHSSGVLPPGDAGSGVVHGLGGQLDLAG